MLSVALAMGLHPETVSRWDSQDVLLLAAKCNLDERHMDRRFAVVIQWMVAMRGQMIQLADTFGSLRAERRAAEIMDDGSRRI